MSSLTKVANKDTTDILTSFLDFMSEAIKFLGGALALKLYASYVQWRKRKSLEKIKSGVNDIVIIFSEAKRIIQASEVDRVLVLKGHNGGSVPKAGSPYYATGLYAEHRDPNKAIDLQSRYEKIKVDGHYVAIINHIIKNGKAILVTKRLEDSLIKNIYISENIKYGEIHYLTNNEKELFYVSFCTEKDITHFDTRTNTQIEIAVSKFRNHLENSL